MRTLEIVLVILVSWALFLSTLALSPESPISSGHLWLACILGSTPGVLWAIARAFHLVFIRRPHP